MTDEMSDGEKRIVEHLHRIERMLAGLTTTMAFQGLGPDAIKSFVHLDHTIRFHLPDALVDLRQRHIMEEQGFFDERVLLSVLRVIDGCACALDIGAGFGNDTVYFSKIATIARVYAYEHRPALSGVLARNVELNALEGVQLESHVPGIVPGGGEATSLKARDFDVPVGFIKIEVDDEHLASVLEALEDVLDQHRPSIWIRSRLAPKAVEQVENYLNTETRRYTVKALAANAFLFSNIPD